MPILSSALPLSAPLALDEPTQREVTRLCARTALLLMQHGAESALVENMVRRLGHALGGCEVEIALMSSAIVITTLSGEHCITTVRRQKDHGINMDLVIELQRLVLDVENGLLDVEAYRQRLETLSPARYPRWAVVLAVGIACAAFARLAHADAVSCLVAFAASAVAMYVRLHLAALHFSPLVTFSTSAFVATSIAAQSLLYGIGAAPKTAMAASVLMLVPGFPLINAVADMFKGHINTGLARWAIASLLTLATCIGVVMAMTLWGLRGWA